MLRLTRCWELPCSFDEHFRVLGESEVRTELDDRLGVTHREVLPASSADGIERSAHRIAVDRGVTPILVAQLGGPVGYVESWQRRPGRDRARLSLAPLPCHRAEVRGGVRAEAVFDASEKLDGGCLIRADATVTTTPSVPDAIGKLFLAELGARLDLAADIAVGVLRRRAVARWSAQGPVALEAF